MEMSNITGASSGIGESTAKLLAIETGRDEVLADDMTRQVKAGLSDEEGIYLNFDPDHTAAAAR